MVKIPAGKFRHNSTETDILGISKPFYLAETEVTRTQFLAIMGTDPTDPDWSSGNSDPVTWCSWYMAIAFCNKLSVAERLEPVYAVSGVNLTTIPFADIPTTFSSSSVWNSPSVNWDANGYRLPTASEWLWAAIGANETDQGDVNTTGYLKKFAGQKEDAILTDYAWVQSNSNYKTHPVKTKLPNELGLYDMTGNATEWCWNRRNTRPVGLSMDYRGDDSDTSRSHLGAAFGNEPSTYTITTGQWFAINPHWRSRTMGLRVALNAPR